MKRYWPTRSRKKLDVGGDLLGSERPEVGDDVELGVADRGADRGGVVGIPPQCPNAVDRRPVGAEAAIELRDVEAELRGKAAHPPRDGAVASDDEHPLRCHAVTLARRRDGHRPGEQEGPTTTNSPRAPDGLTAGRG